MNQTERTALDEWKAHWPLVIAGMIGFSFYAMVTYSLGTFMEPLEKAFGWSRAEISFGLTIFGLCATIGGPPMGAVLDRIGSRRIAIYGLILSGVTFAMFSLASGSLTQWFILWLVFSLCSVAIKSTVWSAGTSSVLTASRALSSSALGPVFVPLIANALIPAVAVGVALSVGVDDDEIERRFDRRVNRRPAVDRRADADIGNASNASYPDLSRSINAPTAPRVATA